MPAKLLLCLFLLLAAGCTYLRNSWHYRFISGGSPLAKQVVIAGLESAFGAPLPFQFEKEAPEHGYDPPDRLIEVRLQCTVSAKNFSRYFDKAHWRKTSVPRGIAMLAPGFEYPTSDHIATSYEKTVGEWDYRIIRCWESEEILLIAVLSKAHARYKSEGLDY